MKTVENSYALASSVRDLNCRGIHLRWSFSLSLFDQRGSSAESISLTDPFIVASNAVPQYVQSRFTLALCAGPFPLSIPNAFSRLLSGRCGWRRSESRLQPLGRGGGFRLGIARACCAFLLDNGGSLREDSLQ